MQPADVIVLYLLYEYSAFTSAAKQVANLARASHPRLRCTSGWGGNRVARAQGTRVHVRAHCMDAPALCDPGRCGWLWLRVDCGHA